MKGVGVAHGAVSVLNAIATGVGGAIGVNLPVKAMVTLTPGSGVTIESVTPWGPVEPTRRLLEAIAGFTARMGYEGGVRVRVESSIPPASGLKSSSAVVNAVMKGILDALGVTVDMLTIARLGVGVTKEAGLTITGAYDDSLATLGEGVFVTDNYSLKILKRIMVGGDYYAVIHVNGSRRVDDVDAEAFKNLGEGYRAAARLALSGEWAAAMTLNGILTLAATGWDPVSLTLISKALKVKGVAAAGVTGKGPAVFAIATDPEAVREAWNLEDAIVARLLGGKG